jgi:hypothetical protein
MVSLLYCHLYDHEPKKLTSSGGASTLFFHLLKTKPKLGAKPKPKAKPRTKQRNKPKLGTEPNLKPRTKPRDRARLGVCFSWWWR